MIDELAGRAAGRARVPTQTTRDPVGGGGDVVVCMRITTTSLRRHFQKTNDIPYRKANQQTFCTGDVVMKAQKTILAPDYPAKIQ